MIKKVFLLFCFVGLFCLGAFAQIPVGNWRTHLPFSKGIAVEQVGNQIYCATENGLIEFNRTDNEMRVFDRVNGLSDIGLSYIRYNSDAKTLVIAYKNGNIDLKVGSRFININALKGKNMTGDKTIFHCFNRGNLAYLSCGFGILELDLTKREIRNTFIIGDGGNPTKVYALTDDGTYFYAATQKGLLRAFINSANLSDFNQWKTVPGSFNRAYRNVALLGNKIITTNSDSIYSFQNESWAVSQPITGVSYGKLETRNNVLIATSTFRPIKFDVNVSPTQLPIYAEITNQQAAICDEVGTVWLADFKLGLVKYLANGFENFSPKGPASTAVFRVRASKNGGVWVCGGGFDQSSYNSLYRIDGAYHFKDDEWKNFNRNTVPATNLIFDWLEAVEDPNSGKAYVATWTGGLLEFENDKFIKHYDSTNSSIQNQIGNPGVYPVGGLAFDSNGDLWMTNYGTGKPLVVKRRNGTWANFSFGSEDKLGALFIDRNNQKWAVLRNGGIWVINAANNRVRFLNNAAGSGSLPSMNVNCIAEDKDGLVWVGTDLGPVVFYSPSSVITANTVDAQRIKVKQGEFVGYLLGTEVINTMAVDGANRKWFGTQNGVFLMSADGTKLIHQFTENNSPLISNNIMSLDIDPKSGEIFFGTDKGLISFRGNATDGTEACTSVKVFPNPVQSTFEGLVTISGLINNGYLKITDVTGNLVYQTRANGGSYSWNKTDYTGRKVNTGVYIVMVTDETGANTCLAKILIEN